jgi:hypothetical protein
MNSSAFARLIFDQGLFARRGVKRWTYCRSSSDLLCESIHP